MNAPPAKAPLFTGPFVTMWAFSFSVFLSLFMLLPVVPFQVLAEGGTETEAGLFMGLLTYSSGLSALFTGALSDHIGRRRQLIICAAAITTCVLLYGVLPTGPRLLFVFLHGIFWSGLLLASSAHVTSVIPATRRAEGLGYWGMSSLLAVTVAPSLGFAVYKRGWLTLCLAVAAMNVVMGLIAWSVHESHGGTPGWPTSSELKESLNFSVLRVSFALFLYSFAFGCVTSFAALAAEARGIAPREVFLTTMAFTTFLSRPVLAPFLDRLGHVRMFRWFVAMIPVGLGLLCFATEKWMMVLAAMVFGLAYGNCHPAFTAYIMGRVDERGRGGAFGGILAAFDVGIGTGSILSGILVHRFGFGVAFGTATVLSALSLPYFNWARPRFERDNHARPIGVPLVSLSEGF
ncbi:MAG: MFS transporter [Vicinamibacteria bacterium]